MFKKITALMIVIFMMMTFTAGCSGSEDIKGSNIRTLFQCSILLGVIGYR